MLLDLPGRTAEGEEEANLLLIVRLAARDATLTGSILWVRGWDACLTDGFPHPQLLQTVLSCTAPVILSGRAGWRAVGLERTRRLALFAFSIPEYSQRKALWLHNLADARHIPEKDLAYTAGQFLLTSSQIRDAAAAALDRAAQHGRPPAVEDVMAAARLHSSARLEGLARKINPRYGWKELILPADQVAILKEILATVRGRPVVLGEWGVGEKLVPGGGLTVLFAGPPGTGKTMAAEILAGELGLDLYKIDLSTIVSKYIGETEKNLERIFSEADASNAILFFDEADALFGKRSEVRDSHDRYANIEISYLLQRMEAYDGVAILATNLRSNLDEAFTRRLQFVVDFPFPEEADRLRIWQALFPPNVPRSDDLDLPLLARRYKLAGGNIRNVIVSAAYLAAADGGVVTMDHLLHSTRRELQKMGRLLDEEERYV